MAPKHNAVPAQRPCFCDEMDDVRLKLFERMAPSIQRYIVAQVRTEVRLGHHSVRLKEPSPQIRQRAINAVMGITSPQVS